MFKYLFLSFIFGASLAFGAEKEICPSKALKNQHRKIEDIKIEGNPDCPVSSTAAFYQDRVPGLLQQYKNQTQLLATANSEEDKREIQNTLQKLRKTLATFAADGKFILDARGIDATKTKCYCSC